MTTIVKAKHWQIFVILLGLIFISKEIEIHLNGGLNQIFAGAAILLINIPILGWPLITGIALNKKLEKDLQLNFYIPTVAALLILSSTSLLIFSMPEDQLSAFLITHMGGFLVFILLLLACMTTICSYTAKALKLNETKEEIGFDDYSGYVFAFLFWAIGVWFLQPRINRLFASEENSQ